MKYLRNPFKKKEDPAKLIYSKIEELVSAYDRESDSTEKARIAGELVSPNRQLIDIYGNRLRSRFGRLVYKKVDVSQKDIIGILDKLPSELEGDNSQVRIVTPYKAEDIALNHMKKRWKRYKKKQGDISFKEYVRKRYDQYLYDQFRSTLEDDSKKPTLDEFKKLHKKKFLKENDDVPANVKDYLVKEYVSDVYIPGSKTDLGIIIPKYYSDGERKIVEIPTRSIEEIVSKYDNISVRELDGAYFIGHDKEMSNIKTVGWALATIAGITFAYNLINGNVDFGTILNNPVEFLKNFVQVKYHEMGTYNGYVDQQFDNTHVDGRLENANGDINMQDANVDITAHIQNGNGVIDGNYQLHGTSGEIVYNAGTPYEAHVPMSINGSDITVDPNNPVELHNFDGNIDGTGHVTGLEGNVRLSGDISGTITGHLTGFARGTLSIAKYFPSYLVKAGVIGLGALKYAWDKRKLRGNPVKELKGVSEELSDLLKELEGKKPRVSIGTFSPEEVKMLAKSRQDLEDTVDVSNLPSGQTSEGETKDVESH